MKLEVLIEQVERSKARSAWARGVRDYALYLLCGAGERGVEELPLSLADFKRQLLNGAGDWVEYSEGGCALIYDADIASVLSAPWELKRTRCGQRPPNKRETWIDVQSRALYQAWNLIVRLAREGGCYGGAR